MSRKIDTPGSGRKEYVRCNCGSRQRLFVQCVPCLSRFYTAWGIESTSKSSGFIFHMFQQPIAKHTDSFAPGFSRPFDPQPLEEVRI